MFTEPLCVREGQCLVITSHEDVEPSSSLLPITYDRFAELVEPGDTVYLGRCVPSACAHLSARTALVNQCIMCDSQSNQ